MLFHPPATRVTQPGRPFGVHALRPPALVVDRSWRVVAMNEAAEEWLCAPADESVGRTLWSALPALAAPPLAARCQLAMQGDCVVRLTVLASPLDRLREATAGPSGGQRPLWELYALPLRDGILLHAAPHESI